LENSKLFECGQPSFETTGFEVKPPLQIGAIDQQPMFLEFISRLAGTLALLLHRGKFSELLPGYPRHFELSFLRLVVDGTSPSPT